VHEHKGEIKESVSMRKMKFLAYITQLSGTGHRGTESVREHTLRGFETSRGNVMISCILIMHMRYMYMIIRDTLNKV